VANYPAIPVSFNQRQDNVDTVKAEDVNVLYREVGAIASDLGVSASGIRISAWGTGLTLDTTTTSWDSLNSRLKNIEHGVDWITTNGFKNNGANTVTIPNATSVGITVVGAASQTASLQEWKNSSGTVIAKVTSTGGLTISGPISSGTVTAVITASAGSVIAGGTP
jgi:hypothetical protein